MPLLSVFILFSCLSFLLADVQVKQTSLVKGVKPRVGKLFYVYTSKTTSTVLTNTHCYVSTTSALTTICGRKRRSAIEEFSSEGINPTLYDEKSSDHQPEDEEELDGSLSEKTESEEREEKALLYWLTTFSVTTSYSYTQTFTLASLVCTPSGYEVTECKSL